MKFTQITFLIEWHWTPIETYISPKGGHFRSQEFQNMKVQFILSQPSEKYFIPTS